MNLDKNGNPGYYIQNLRNSNGKRIPHSLNMKRVLSEANVFKAEDQSSILQIGSRNNTSRDQELLLTEPNISYPFLKLSYTERNRDQSTILKTSSIYRDFRASSRTLGQQFKLPCEQGSSIMEDTSKIYQDKFNLIQSVCDSTARDRKSGVMQGQVLIPLITKKKYTNIIIYDGQVHDVDFVKNQFAYVQLAIQHKLSPLAFSIKGEKKSQFKIFASLCIPRPNPFNCDIEVLGSMLKFSTEELLFKQQYLYITIYSKQDCSVQLSVEFFNQKRQKSMKSTFAAFQEKVKKDKDKSEVSLTSNLKLQFDVECILAKRKLKVASKVNYLEFNKMAKEFDIRVKYQKIEQNRIQFQENLVKSKKKKQQSLESLIFNQVAHQKTHDIAYDLKTEMMQITVKSLRKEYFEKNWIKVIYLSEVFVPHLRDLINHQRLKIQKKMKQQFDSIVWVNRVIKLMNLMGPNSIIRALGQTKILVESQGRLMKKKSVKRARCMVASFLTKTSVNYHSYKAAQRLINIMYNAIHRLMKYKQNKSVFMEQIKFFLANDMKFLQNEAFYYLKDEEVSPQKVSKKKTQLIYLTNEIGFSNELSRIIFKYVFEKWNLIVYQYRDVMRSDKKNQKSLALLLHPPKLFEIPQMVVVREIFLQLLCRKGLIQIDIVNNN